MSLPELLAEHARVVDAALDRLTPPATTHPETIHRAMRYSLFAGGKRIRPILCIESAAALAHSSPAALEAGCAVEMIHTYSLIHDDLPALDNDDLRRGKPTCHKVFGEAMAILAGDALFTLAMQTLVRIEELEPERKLSLVEELSFAGGTVDGMIGGQVTDLEGENQTPTAELLNLIHRAKTGALLRASVRMGAICAAAKPEELQALSDYGEHLGLAFQIVDDLLDVEQSSEALGKTAGKDAAQGKITFPAVYGFEASRRMAGEERDLAHHALDSLGAPARRLHELANYIVDRKS